MSRVAIRLLFLAALAAPLGMAQQAPAPPPVAKLTQFTGDVLLRREQTWSRVDKAPLDLRSGDLVSADRGRAEIHFLRDDSTLVLDVGAHLTIMESDSGGGLLRRIQIFLGDVWFHFQRGGNHKTDLVTPTAVGGLRGTEGLVHVEDQSQSEFTLKEGALEITRNSAAAAGAPAGESVALEAGQTLRAKTGQPLQAVRAAALPARPPVNVAARDLPKPRANWRSLVSKENRPPSAVKGVPPSSRALASTGGTSHAKLGAASKPPKRTKKTRAPVGKSVPSPFIGGRGAQSWNSRQRVSCAV